MNDWTRLTTVARREPRLDSVARANRAVRVLGWMLASGACVLLCASKARADVGAEADPHAHHHHMMQAPPPVTRSTANYSVPDIPLVRADGTHVKLAQELDDGRPVLLDFIYTTCTTICPVMSQTFAEVQKRLGPQAAKVKMMSVSIDPEEDTPSRLTEYAKRYQAGPQWSFYTGTAQASIDAQRVFSVYRGDKMNHSPVALFRSAPGQPWVRLDGFATPDALVSEIHTQLAQK